MNNLNKYVCIVADTYDEQSGFFVAGNFNEWQFADDPAIVKFTFWMLVNCIKDPKPIYSTAPVGGFCDNYKTLATRTKISEKTLRRITKEMQEAGDLEIIPVKHRRGYKDFVLKV